MRWWFFASSALAVAIACGSSVPTPQYTAQPTSALSPVPYPPPPARVETIPKQPRNEAVWIDGEWVWQTRRWAWRKGRWIVPPAGAKFAPWTTVRDKSGTLYAAVGVWRNANGDEVQEPEPIAQGKPRAAADVVEPDSHLTPVGAPASSAAETFGGKHDVVLDASGPPTLANDAAVSDQLLDASALAFDAGAPP
jgi:hypothetical protein